MAKTTASPARQIWILLGIIIGLSFLLGIVALILRKRLMTPTEQVPMGFTLKDLRKMHELGQLSDEELAQAEAKALARSRSHYLGAGASPDEEVEDLGHLSTGSEDDLEGGTENTDDSSDKNLGDGPRL